MLSDVQEFNLVLVREIDEICRKHDIPYYLAGGSVIGVLRHRGFIPWDDDMDLYMTRDNWLRFREAFDEERPENRSLECSDIDPNYPNMIAKYTSTDTTAIYRNLVSGRHNAGIIVDILILDPVPDDEVIQRQHLDNLLLYSEYVNPYYVFSHRFDVESEYETYRKREREVGHEALVRELEQKVTQYSEEESGVYIMRWGGVPHIFPKDLFGTPKLMPFEGIMLPVPEKAYLYLSQLYGEDWVQVPPHSEEIIHEAVFSIERSFKEFFEDFGSHIDADSYIENVVNRKRNRLEAGPSFREIQNTTLELEARRLKMRVRLIDEEHHLRDLYDAGRFNEIEELLAPYFEEQCSSRFLGNKYYAGVARYFNPVYVDIGDDLAWVVVELLSRQGRLHHPKRIIEARCYRLGDLSDELQGQQNAISLMLRAIDAYEQGDFDAVLSLVDEGLSSKPDWVNFMKLKIIVLERDIDANRDEIAQLIAAGRAVSTEDGDWTKFEGDLCRTSDPDRAMELYHDASEHTRNGIMLLDIDTFFEEVRARIEPRLIELIGGGNLEEARELLDHYLPYMESLAFYDDLLTISLGDDDGEAYIRYMQERNDKKTHGAELPAIRLFHAVWVRMGAREEDIPLLEKLKTSGDERRQLDEETLERCRATSDDAIRMGYGNYLYSVGDYAGAFTEFQAFEQVDNPFLQIALSEAFCKDLALFYNRFARYKLNSRKASRSVREWFARHGSFEKWLHSVTDVIDLDAFPPIELEFETRKAEVEAERKRKEAAAPNDDSAPAGEGTLDAESEPAPFSADNSYTSNPFGLQNRDEDLYDVGFEVTEYALHEISSDMVEKFSILFAKHIDNLMEPENG